MRPHVVLVAACGIAAAVCGSVVFSPGQMARLRSLEEEARTLESEVQNARAQNAHLADDVRVLRGDDPGSRAMLEKLARDELGYLGKGEVVLVMPSDAR